MFLWGFVNRLLRAPPIAGDTPGLNTCFPPFLPTHRLHGFSLRRPSTLPTTPFPHHRTLSPRAIYSRTLLASTEPLAETAPCSVRDTGRDTRRFVRDTGRDAGRFLSALRRCPLAVFRCGHFSDDGAAHGYLRIAERCGGGGGGAGRGCGRGFGAWLIRPR